MLLQYKRLIYFDVNGLVLKNMNHLFQLPFAPVAMPRAYWLPQPTMSDQLAVVEPSVSSLYELLHQAEAFGEGLQHFGCMGWVLQASCWPLKIGLHCQSACFSVRHPSSAARSAVDGTI